MQNARTNEKRYSLYHLTSVPLVEFTITVSVTKQLLSVMWHVFCDIIDNCSSCPQMVDVARLVICLRSSCVCGGGDCFIIAVFPKCNSHMMPDRVKQQATEDNLLVGTQKLT